MAEAENNRQDAGRAKQSRAGETGRDLLTIAIAGAAILMFVGTGGSVLPAVMRSLSGTGLGPDRMLVTALLLNIALVIFGWRRYRELINEVRNRREAEEQARILAQTDPLTGCLNRRSIGEVTNAMIGTARPAGMAVAFLMLDLDNFKQINDVHGHAAGDRMLCEATARLRRIIPADGVIARIGGDEFACAVRFDPNQSQVVERLAEQLIEAVSRPVEHGDTTLETTISLGLSRSDGESSANDAQTLLHKADIAMYHAKKQGRNRYYWFEQSMESELRFRSELEGGIRRGVANGEFVPFYEKQIDMTTGELSGFEMLARWNSPTLGVINPEIFIPIAEEIGVISELSEGLIREALKDARLWDPRLTLSVNISPVQLRDPWFAQKLLKLLVEGNFPPSRLEIEVTETCLHENVGLVRSLITSLKNQGIKVSLDDFGTGYSSLAQLRTLPFDRIKIDRSFVTTLLDSKDSATIIQSIASLGEGLGLPITAEGVETEAVLRELQRFGNFKAQGYFYGRPASAARTMDELRQLDLLLEAPAPAPAESEYPSELPLAGNG